MLLFLMGLVSGIVSGMGIGGGTVLIPALIIFARSRQHIAQSTNLLFFIPTAIAALVVHIKNKNIAYRTAVPIALAGAAGAVSGSMLAISLPGPSLKKWFGVFLLAMGFYEMLRKDKK